MKLLISILFPLAGLFLVSFIIEEFGTLAGSIVGVILAANYYFLMRKF